MSDACCPECNAKPPVEKPKVELFTYVNCPECAATLDTEGWKENKDQFCPYCHKGFTVTAVRP